MSNKWREIYGQTYNHTTPQHPYAANNQSGIFLDQVLKILIRYIPKCRIFYMECLIAQLLTWSWRRKLKSLAYFITLKSNLPHFLLAPPWALYTPKGQSFEWWAFYFMKVKVFLFYLCASFLCTVCLYLSIMLFLIGLLFRGAFDLGFLFHVTYVKLISDRNRILAASSLHSLFLLHFWLSGQGGIQ